MTYYRIVKILPAGDLNAKIDQKLNLYLERTYLIILIYVRPSDKYPRLFFLPTFMRKVVVIITIFHVITSAGSYNPPTSIFSIRALVIT